MRLFEYEAKGSFAKFGLPIPWILAGELGRKSISACAESET